MISPAFRIEAACRAARSCHSSTRMGTCERHFGRRMLACERNAPELRRFRRAAQSAPAPGSAEPCRGSGGDDMAETMKEIVLARRPEGDPVPEDFRLEEH